jgi:hypothetical protein
MGECTKGEGDGEQRAESGERRTESGGKLLEDLDCKSFVRDVGSVTLGVR